MSLYSWYLEYNLTPVLKQKICPGLAKNLFVKNYDNSQYSIISEPLCDYIIIQVAFIEQNNKLTIAILIKNLYNNTYIFRVLDSDTNIDQLYDNKHFILKTETKDDPSIIFNQSPFNLKGSGWTQQQSDYPIIVYLRKNPNE